MLSSASRNAVGGRLALALVVVALSGRAASAQTVVTWTNGGGDGNYSNPLNWNPPTVPINTMADTYTVIIPANQTVNIDFATPASIEVTDFMLGSSARFILRPGRTYTVLDDADVGGAIEADGAGTLFSAIGPGAAVTGNAARFIATGGAQVEVAGTTYTYAQTGHNTLMSATNAGSRLNLGGIDNVVFGAGGGRWFQSIRAANSGVIDLSGLQNISIAPGQDDVLDIIQETGGSIDLSGLQSINGLGNGNGNVRFFTDAADLTLASLSNANGVTFTPAVGATVNLPSLTALTNSTVDQAAGSTFNAPSLADVNGSNLTLSPAHTFISAPLSQIDNANIAVQAGMNFANVIDANYNYTRTGGGDILSATDPGSLFDLSSVTSLTYGPGGGRWFSAIRATNSGMIDLSNLAGINMVAGQDDVLDFVVQSGGSIDLSGLQSINFAGNGNARARFIVSESSFTLPSLIAAVGAEFLPAEGTTINTPFLTSLTGSFVTLAENSSLNAPALTNISGTDITVSPTRQFNSGLLSQIDNSNIAVVGGLNYANFSDGDYNYTRAGGGIILSASDPGSVLDLTPATSILYGPGGGRWFSTIRAAASGLVDLSGVSNIGIVAGQDDVLAFTAETGGVIDLTGLQSVDAASGNVNALVRFTAANGGTINFGNLEVTRQTQFDISGVSSTMSVAGNMLLDSGSLTISAGATLTVDGDMTFRYTSETNLSASSAILHLNGIGTLDQPQNFEIGGLDAGNMDPGNSGNFGFGQLIVGDFGNTTVVQLLDVIDNGNRGALRGGGAPEALYLFGLGGPDGLILRNGSTLIIDNLNVYTTENNQWVHINSLFPQGVTLIPYSGGFIELPSPGSGLVAALFVGSIARRRRQR